ncbi:MAG: Dephospho-CoA kinase [Planctomycetota bacterium]|jgi:dephospho-CoA kinase
MQRSDAIRPPTIGIAGGIGGGKSTVARILRELGCEVANSDDAARRVLAEPEVRARIATRAGPAVVAPDGSIDRAALGRAIFAEPSLRADIERIMHPRIESIRRAQFAAAPASTRAFVIDAPLLFEVGLDRECDAVIFIDTPRELRLARVHAARGWSSAELDRRESAQLPIDEKRRRSSDVVENSADEQELRARTERTLRAIETRLGHPQA